MKKDLPHIFKGKVEKNLNQNETVINKEIEVYDHIDEIVRKDLDSVNRQINNIFNSENFIYKADTLITLKSGEKVKKTIIGKNNNSLITMDDDLIEINSIENIEKI